MIWKMKKKMKFTINTKRTIRGFWWYIMDEKLQILLVPNNKTKEEFTTNKNTQWQPWRKNTVSSIIMREPKKEKNWKRRLTKKT